MKIILGVKKSTNNCLIYAETGRYPLYICIYIRIVKYWFKISNASEHRYIYIIYNKCPSSWSLFVRKILYEYGFGYVWEANAVGIPHPVFIKQYEQRLKDTFQQKCRSEIANSNRCSLYNHLHREFTMANYLNKVQIRTNRRALTKLRLSSHRLLIERGRWLKIKQENRLCTECRVLEDEYHVVCFCLRYAELRNRFIKPYYINSPSRIKFSQLMNSDNVKDMKSLASFIKSLFNWYNMYLFI